MKSFIIFGMGRTGSTLLASLLNSHPLICCEGEVFNQNRWRSYKRPMAYLWQHYPWPYLTYRRLRAKGLQHKAVYGFKLHTKVYYPQVAQPAQFLERAAQSGWKIIHLERNVLFDQVISSLIANATRRYFGHEQANEPTVQLHIPVDKFANQLEQTITTCRRNRQILADLPHLSIRYEAHLAEATYWSSTVARICDYLTIPIMGVIKSEIMKPWRQPYAELLVNYAELHAYYQNHALACEDILQC